MRKYKIALFANGWSAENLSTFLECAKKEYENKNTDLYAFVAYPEAAIFEDLVIGAYSVFSIPNLDLYDAFIVLSSSINEDTIITDILDRCLDTGKPVISVGKEYKNCIYASMDNEIGMADLCEHLISYHNVKRVSYVGGYKTHIDSVSRENTIRRVLKAHNLSLSENDITYTDWDDVNAIAFVTHKIENKDLPDAFVCANDGLAMATCTVLESNGIKVPDDVIVTGFDYLLQSRVFSPSIATVEQPFEKLANKCFRVLYAAILGRKAEKKIIIPCAFHSSESCGCKAPAGITKTRAEFCKKFYSDGLRRNKASRMIASFELTIDGSDTYNELVNNFRENTLDYINSSNDMLYILLNPKYFSKTSNTVITTEGYSENMDVFYGMENGMLSVATVCNRASIFPAITNDNNCHTYVILPLYESSTPFGYMVFRDVFYSIKNHVLQNYASHLMASLSKYRQEKNLSFINGDLLMMAKKDPLTNVKNRAAFEEAILSVNSELSANPNAKLAIVMFDINNLKQINDELGHKAGDEYIKNSCNLICYIFPQSPVFRIGGDEFCAIVRGSEYQNRYELLKKGKENMETLEKAKLLPRVQRVSIAVGISEFIPGKDKCFHDIFNRADALMYENKAEMKARQNEKPR